MLMKSSEYPMTRVVAWILCVAALWIGCHVGPTFGLAAAQEGGAKNSGSVPLAASQWEKEIAAIEEQDKTAAPPKQGIVFVGSSSIRLWDLRKSFPDLQVVNRGFGGSQLADSVHFLDRLVLPHQPKTVVLYAGDNDLASGKFPEQISADFAAFVKLLRKTLPETRIIYIAVKPSPARWKIIDKQRETNRLVRQQCELGEKMVFLDVEKPLLGADGSPKAELFQKDGLHLNADGYKIWSDLLLPLLQ